ncbi:porin family protein [Kaistella montana]|uniref:OmpW family outer membrane protein n=1 Tax=Kaistella montana TaxID=1849733 RepID=A0ABW5K955_9FLAO|nr:porin family protein [Kaistella montana]MCQ4034479.1 porin family protein [Kaistella montana]
MKKLLLVGALALFAAVNAQTEKGNWMVSGKSEIAFNSTNAKVKFQGNEVSDVKTSTFAFTPAASYFVINNLAVGLGLSYNHSKTGDSKSDTFTVIPQTTYFFPVAGEVKPYVEAGIGYATNKTTEGGEDFKLNGLAYGFGAGVAYFVTPNVAFNLGLNYTAANLKYSENNDLESNTNNLGAGVGISVFFK